MRKVLIQAILIAAVFFISWFIFKKIDWMSIFKVEKATQKTEEKLGAILLDIFKKSDKEINNQFATNSIDSIVNKLCIENNINRKLIKVHILAKDEINAFALPNGHLVVYSGLIKKAANQEELCGVIGHEIAHIQLNHVMKKLVKEMGLAVLISMTTGNGGGELVIETAKMLSSTAFDRSLEKDADIKSVDYLIKAKVNPEPFANFLYSISENESKVSGVLTWVSTHPDSKERAEYIIEYIKQKKVDYQSIISDETWDKLLLELKKTD